LTIELTPAQGGRIASRSHAESTYSPPLSMASNARAFETIAPKDTLHLNTLPELCTYP